MKKCSCCRNIVQDNINYCPTCGSSSFVFEQNNQVPNNIQYNYEYNGLYMNQYGGL